MLLDNIVYIKKSSSLTDELKETYKNSIIFVEDEAVIWTHKKCFGLSETNLEALKTLINNNSPLTITNGETSISSKNFDTLEISNGEGIILTIDDTAGTVSIGIDFDSLYLTDDEIDELCK